MEGYLLTSCCMDAKNEMMMDFSFSPTGWQSLAAEGLEAIWLFTVLIRGFLHSDSRPDEVVTLLAPVCAISYLPPHKKNSHSIP